MTQSERVILIQGDAEKWYDQAIFIVKPENKRGDIPHDMVTEAERIIYGYLNKNKKPLPSGFPKAGVVGYASGAAGANGADFANGINTANASFGKKNKASRLLDYLLNILMVLACLALAGVLMYGLGQ